MVKIVVISYIILIISVSYKRTLINVPIKNGVQMYKKFQKKMCELPKECKLLQYL